MSSCDNIRFRTHFRTSKAADFDRNSQTCNHEDLCPHLPSISAETVSFEGMPVYPENDLFEVVKVDGAHDDITSFFSPRPRSSLPAPKKYVSPSATQTRPLHSVHSAPSLRTLPLQTCPDLGTERMYKRQSSKILVESDDLFDIYEPRDGPIPAATVDLFDVLDDWRSSGQSQRIDGKRLSMRQACTGGKPKQAEQRRRGLFAPVATIWSLLISPFRPRVPSC